MIKCVIDFNRGDGQRRCGDLKKKQNIIIPTPYVCMLRIVYYNISSLAIENNSKIAITVS